MKNITITITSLLLIGFLLSCEDDNDNVNKQANTGDIRSFVEENMKTYYFWNEDIPKQSMITEPTDYFYSILNKDYDHWSFITDDYQALVKYFEGVSKSSGYSAKYFLLAENSNDVIGFIEYVTPNSPAERAGLIRGDMIYKINNELITRDNYSRLLSLDNYILTLGVLNPDKTIVSRQPSIDITSEELSVNPIHMSKVITHQNKKYGYLVYNSFISKYDKQLEDVFSNFKAEGIESLILDLRYNGGGAVSTAILMSSMIAPKSAAKQVFIRTKYNKILEDYIKKTESDPESFFINRLFDHPNNLNLNKLVVLTTNGTASASEMIIYGLKPYMEVYQIGAETTGKYYASMTIDDVENHNWAIQPLILKSENANNSINYNTGLLPDLALEESWTAKIYPLGDVREEFLARALYYLTGQYPSSFSLKNSSAIKPLQPANIETKINNPLKYEMHIDLKR